jgi:hypothetical protein
MSNEDTKLFSEAEIARMARDIGRPLPGELKSKIMQQVRSRTQEKIKTQEQKQARAKERRRDRGMER